MEQGELITNPYQSWLWRLDLPHLLSARCEVNQGDALEQASPVTDVVVERNEDFYDQSYVNEKENTGTEVSYITATTCLTFTLLLLMNTSLLIHVKQPWKASNKRDVSKGKVVILLFHWPGHGRASTSGASIYPSQKSTGTAGLEEPPTSSWRATCPNSCYWLVRTHSGPFPPWIITRLTDLVQMCIQESTDWTETWPLAKCKVSSCHSTCTC